MQKVFRYWEKIRMALNVLLGKLNFIKE